MDAPKDCGSTDFSVSSAPTEMAHLSLLKTRTLSCGQITAWASLLQDKRCPPQDFPPDLDYTRVKSQYNPSLGSNGSDKERKRQIQLELQ